jgi:hypothetical protein
VLVLPGQAFFGFGVFLLTAGVFTGGVFAALAVRVLLLARLFGFV